MSQIDIFQSSRLDYDLRSYQSQAKSEVIKKLDNGDKNVLLVLPTGAGKTITSVAIADHYLSQGKKVLFVISLIVLVEQTIEAFVRHGFPRDEIGVINATSRLQTDKQLQICMVQTFHRRKHIDLSHYDLIIIDEAHKSANDQHSRFYDQCHGKILGLTATPELDHRGRYPESHPKWPRLKKQIGRYYQDFVQPIHPKDLMDMGYLVDCVIHTYKTTASSHKEYKIDPKTGDYKTCEVERVFNIPEMWQHLLQEYLEKGEGLPALGFCVTQEHAKNITEYFVANGVESKYIIATTTIKEREAIFEQLDSGEIKVVFSVNCLSEGFDLPKATVALLARPTALRSVKLQQIGRVLRPHPDKKKAIVIDQADNTVVRCKDTQLIQGYIHPFDNCPVDLSIDNRTPEDVKREERERVEREKEIALRLGYQNEVLDRETTIINNLINVWKEKGYKKYWVVVQYIKSTYFPSLASFKHLEKLLSYGYGWSKHIYLRSCAYNYYVIFGNFGDYASKMTNKEFEEIMSWRDNNKFNKTETEEISLDLYPKSYTPQLQKAYSSGGKELLRKVYKLLCFQLHPDRNDVSVKWIQQLNNDYDKFTSYIH